MDNQEKPTYPSQLPEGIERRTAVVDTLQQSQSQIKSGEATTPYIDVRQNFLVDAQRSEADATLDAQRAITVQGKAESIAAQTAKNAEEQEASFFGIGKLFGGRRRQQNIEGAEHSAQDAREAYTVAASTLKEAQERTSDAAQQLQQATEREIRRHDEVIQGNLRGGPVEAGPAFTSALKEQDILAQRGKSIEAAAGFYKEHIPQVENRDHMLPIEAIQGLKDQIKRVRVGKDLDRYQAEIATHQKEIDRITSELTEAGHQDKVGENFSIQQHQKSIENIKGAVDYTNRSAEKDANDELTRIAFLYETAIKYAESAGISVDQDLLIEAINKGRLLEPNRFPSREKDSRESKTRAAYRQFVGGIIGQEPTWRMMDPVDEYSFVAFLLKGFAQKHDLPQTESLVPYAIAMIAGANDRHARNEETLQRLLYDLLPVDTPTSRREGDKWIDETVHRDPPGLGSQISIFEYDSNMLDNTTNAVVRGSDLNQINRVAVAQAAELIRGPIGSAGGFRAGINGWQTRLPQGWRT